MKRKAALLLLLPILLFTSCSSKHADMKFIIPSDYIGAQTQEDLDKLAKDYGYSVTLNSDGSATYTMTQKQHKEFINDCYNEIQDNLTKMIASETYPNITKIETNENLTEFTITTKSTELDNQESFSVLSFYLYGELYNLFNGNTEEANNISVTFLNADTGTLISSFHSNDNNASDNNNGEIQ